MFSTRAARRVSRETVREATEDKDVMATFSSTGQTVFREGDPAIPDIAAEKRGKAPQNGPRNGRDDTGFAGKTRSKASRRLRRGSGIARRALDAFARRGDRSEGRLYELDGTLSARLKEEADRRSATEREVLEEAVRLYLAGRRNGGER